jgi:1-deoxy-D-xylulose-5-phosphate synthase
MGTLLDQIQGPADLKKLSRSELDALAAEVREEIVSVVSANGGHLASNLGVVELTIALHRVFDSPKDKIVWDVGHQAYTHKLLTGRKDRFATLRQFGGLSGFTTRGESEHDPFGAGHASTSVSAALGMEVARDLSGEDHNVIAVIGDGAVTGGMALEGLNHVGHVGSRMIVILNDNGMSISPTVGALARIMSRVRFDYRYGRAKDTGRKIVTRLPWGNRFWWLGRQMESGLRGMFMPTKLWESLGFAYLGPVDGHDIQAVEAALVRARDYPREPAFVHIVTTKGKGHQGAEGDAVYFHGISGNNSHPKTAPTYSEVFAATIQRLARQEPKLVAITPAMPEGNHLSAVIEEFPKRVFDVGICEQHAVTFAAGLATQGYLPVVAIYSTFLQRSFDQIIHDVCLQELPVVFAIDRGGIVGDDGKTHQGAFDISYLTLVPGLIVASPKDENELQHMLYTATKAGRPMAVRYPRSPGAGVAMDEEFREMPIGKGEILREGSDVALVAIGSMVGPAMAAADKLAAAGIEATVVNARFAKPLDGDLLKSVAEKTARVLTIEENVLGGGFGSAVVSLLKESGLPDLAVHSLGLPDEFIEHGGQDTLRARYYLDAAGIAGQVRVLFPSLVGEVTPSP